MIIAGENRGLSCGTPADYIERREQNAFANAVKPL